MSMAISYAMRKKMNKGGKACYAHGAMACKECYAKGGEAKDSDDKGKSDHSHMKFGEGYDKGRDLKGIHEAKYNKKGGNSAAGTDYRRSKEKDYGQRREYSPAQRLADSKRKHAQVLSEMKKIPHGKLYADGGFVDEEEASGYLDMPEAMDKRNATAEYMDNRDLNQHGAHEIGPQGTDQGNESFETRKVEHEVPNQDWHPDLVDRIMQQRHYSEGGRVANDTDPVADFEPNEFDLLVKDGGLESSYTAQNSGDEIGNEALDESEEDMIARIMRQRRMKDRNPVPA